MDLLTKASEILKTSKPIRRDILLIAVLGIVLRVFLTLFSVHPDFFFIFLFPNLVSHHHIIDVYSLFESELSTRAGFYYTPVVLFFFAPITFLASLISPDTVKVMENAYSNYASGATNPLSYLQTNGVNYSKVFALLKLPYLIFDIGTLFLLLKLIKNKKGQLGAINFWILNPVLLYGTYVYGQFDVISAFLIVLSLYFATKNKIYLSLFTIGLAATFKNFALVLVIPYALILTSALKERVVLLALGLLPFLLSTLIVYIQAPSQAIYTLIPKFYIAKGTDITTTYEVFSRFSRFLALAIIYLLCILIAAKLKVNKIEKLIYLSTISLTAVFAFSPIILFHYLNIVVPVLILTFNGVKHFYKVMLLLILSTAIFKLWTPVQLIGVFAPIDFKFLTNIPSHAQLIDRVVNYGIVSSFFYVVFFAICMLIIVYSFYKLIFVSKK